MFKAHKAPLLSALTKVKDVAAKKDTIPILQNVLIDRSPTGITLTATDLDCEISMTCEAFVGKEFFAFTAPATILTDIVKTMPDGEIAVNAGVSGSTFTSIVVSSGRAKLKCPTVPAIDFPKIGGADFPHTFKILDADAFTTDLSAVSYAVCKDSNRYYIGGVCMCRSDEGLNFVATDGHRMERRSIQQDILEGDVSEFPTIIIPAPAVNRILRLLADHDIATVDVSDAKIRVSSGSSSFTSKLIDGTFPEWRQFAKANEGKVFSANPKDMDASLTRLLTVCENKSALTLFQANAGTLTMRVRGEFAEESEDIIDITCDSSVSVFCNGNYVRDMLSARNSDRLEVYIRDPGSPMFFCAAGSPQNFSIIMPMSGWVKL